MAWVSLEVRSSKGTGLTNCDHVHMSRAQALIELVGPVGSISSLEGLERTAHSTPEAQAVVLFIGLDFDRFAAVGLV